MMKRVKFVSKNIAAVTLATIGLTFGIKSEMYV
jgi:hypothetical protein